MILLIGASASGKTEIAKLLRSRFQMVKAVTHTTRPMRVGETNDVDYHFVSEEEFQKLLKEDAFVETTFYNGNHYGCSKKEIGHDKCVIVDPNGLKAFLALHDPSIITFRLDAEEKTREARMRLRKDKEEDIERRIKNDRRDFADEVIAPTDYRIKTDDRSLEDLTEEIHEEYLKTLKRRGLL